MGDFYPNLGEACEREGGLMVSALDSGSNFERWPGSLCCVLGQLRHFALIVHLSTQEYKWVVLETKCWGVTCIVQPAMFDRRLP